MYFFFCVDSSEDEENEEDRQLVDNMSFSSVDVGVMPLTGSTDALAHLTAHPTNTNTNTSNNNHTASLSGIFPSAQHGQHDDTPKPRRSRLNSHSTPLQAGSDLQLNTLANAHSANNLSGGQLNEYFNQSMDSYDQNGTFICCF